MGAGQFGIDPGYGRARRRRDRGGASEAGLRALRRRRRRQHLPRPGRGRQGHRPRDRRLYGHAGDGDERARRAERARADRRRHARAVGDPDGDGVRALHPPPRRAPPGKGPGRDLRRRRRQPVLHHRQRRRAARRRDEVRRLFKGTSVDGVYDADPKKVADAKRYETVSFDTRAARRSQGHGRQRDRAVPRQQYSDRRLQHPRAGQSCPGARAARASRRSSATEE